MPVGPSAASYAGFLLARSGADGNAATRKIQFAMQITKEIQIPRCLDSIVVERGFGASTVCQAASCAGNEFHAKARRPLGLQRVALALKTGDWSR